MPTPPKKPTNPKDTPPNDNSSAPNRRWGSIIWYSLLAMLLLWMWQEAFNQVTVKTIPYSAFKDFVAKKEVAEANIGQDDIRGLIRLRPASPGEVKPKAGEKEAAAAKPKQAGAEAAAVKPKAGEAPAAAAHGKAGKVPAGEAKAPTPKDKEAAQPQEFNFRTERVEDPKLVEALQAAGVKFAGVRPSMFSQLLWAWIIPIGVMVLLWSLLSRRLGSAREAVFGFGKSPARLVADQSTGVTFADVAGCDEAKYELQEVVDFLKNPERYRKLGATIPKGVLLSGPPGTGKTLLARAVAGEARVPFFSMSGSDFVEMFVGVGAARVRDLFQQAKKQAPCIIFIDELDAIGRQRGVHVGAVNDEREQTLNQLLVEMDGFDPNVGVIVLAATNRPDVLDRALLRPGRFDRQVVVDAPDLNGREAILKIHTRGKPLADNVNLHRIAQATPGFSGADLANAMNEAALLAARRRSPRITQADLEEAVEKVVAGPERKSRRLLEEEKKRVAYHEVGHALVAAYSKYADPVHKISIVPRGRAALGYTLQVPTDDQFLLSRSALVDRIKGLLGGRAAEQTVFNEVSTGAENDLERATALARQMVCMFGMSETIGLVHCAQREGPFYMPGSEASLQRDCSEATAREVDLEVKKLLNEAYAEARKILTEHRDQLERVAQELLKHESLDADAFNALLGRMPEANGTPVPSADGHKEERGDPYPWP